MEENLIEHKILLSINDNNNKKSRKTMTMYGGLHPKSDVDRLYMKRKEGGRGLIGVERCVREEENSLGFYVANSGENLIRGVGTAGQLGQKGSLQVGNLRNRGSKD